MAEHLQRFTAPEGVVLVGRAQEKTPVFRTQKRRNPTTGQAYPWLVRSTAMINHFYFYAVDRDFGPLFLKFGTYFIYNAKLCLKRARVTEPATRPPRHPPSRPSTTAGGM